MTFTIEILSREMVWLINEDRQLFSIHLNVEEAEYYCRRHFQETPRVVDRRGQNIPDTDRLSSAPIH